MDTTALDDLLRSYSTYFQPLPNSIEELDAAASSQIQNYTCEDCGGWNETALAEFILRERHRASLQLAAAEQQLSLAKLDCEKLRSINAELVAENVQFRSLDAVKQVIALSDHCRSLQGRITELELERLGIDLLEAMPEESE